MRRVVPGLALAFAALALVPSPEAAAPGYKVVVASTNPVASIDRGDLAKIFLKSVTRWKDGREIVPVDQSGRSAVRTEFTRDVLEKVGMSRLSAVESYWQQQIYSGRGVPPPVKASDAEVLAFVAANPGAIGYVSAAADTAGVKVVETR
jgi:ABC-type phosphate transport system substrate-binding protein